MVFVMVDKNCEFLWVEMIDGVFYVDCEGFLEFDVIGRINKL